MPEGVDTGAAGTFEDLLVQYIEYYRKNDPADRSAFNNVKRDIGEILADLAIDEKFGERAKSRAVPRRGREGPPILDKAYELEPGEYLCEIDGRAIVVEAKFGES